MTIGSQISDNRTNVTGNCGPALVGSYFSKTWNGADAIDEADRLNPHPYSCTIISSYNPEIRWRSFDQRNTLPWFTGSVASCFGGAPMVSVPWDGNDELKLIGKLSNKIRGNDFNGDAFLAESHQTLALLSSTARRLGGFLEALRHGNLYRASKYLGGPSKSVGSKVLKSLKRELTPNGQSTGTLANAILEVQYGWRPLLQDAHSFGEALGHIYTKIPIQTYRVQRKVQENTDTSGGGITFNARATKLVRLIVTISQQPASSTILHMNDPLAAAWEFTPWSFIADWFIPIGAYLAALNAYRELNLKSIVRTEVVTFSSNIKTVEPNYVASGYEDYFLKTKTINRTLPSVSQNPSNIPLPAFKPLGKIFSPEHCLNAFALLHGSASQFNKSLKF